MSPPPPTPPAAAAITHKWRFGYGSNLGLKTLREKKQLSVESYHVGTIKGYELCKNDMNWLFILCAAISFT